MRARARARIYPPRVETIDMRSMEKQETLARENRCLYYQSRPFGTWPFAFSLPARSPPRASRYYSTGSYEKLARPAKYASTFTLYKQNVNRNPELFAFDPRRRVLAPVEQRRVSCLRLDLKGFHRTLLGRILNSTVLCKKRRISFVS